MEEATETAERERKAMVEADERGRFERAYVLLRGELVNQNMDSVQAELQRLRYDLIDPAAKPLITQIHTLLRRNLALLGDARRQEVWDNSKRSLQRVEQIKRDAEAARAQAETAYQQWRQIAEQVLQQRIDAINRS